MISVVTGTLNRFEYLKAMMASVRENARDYHFVIADGGSTDGTVEWLKKQPDVTLLENAVGVVNGINQAFNLARGFIVNLNDDVIVHGDIFNLEQFRDPTVGQVTLPFSDKVLDKDYMYVKLGYHYYLYANFGITRKELGDKVGWWGDYRKYAGDSELSMQIHRLGYRVEEYKGTGWIEHLEVSPSLNLDSEKFYAKWTSALYSQPSGILVGTKRDG